MKRTLYDLLGVRRDASRAEIEKAYDRLKLMYGGAGGHEMAVRDGCSMPLVEEAFATLSSPAKRESYDASLQRAAKQALETRYAATMDATAAPGSGRKWALLALVVLLAAGWFLKASYDAQVERERQALELRRIEQERLVAEAEAERLRAENEREATRLAAEDRRLTREAQSAMARYGSYRPPSEHSDQWRQDMQRQQAEREQQRQAALERQARERELYQRQMRDAQDRRYLEQYKDRVRVAN